MSRRWIVAMGLSLAAAFWVGEKVADLWIGYQVYKMLGQTLAGLGVTL